MTPKPLYTVRCRTLQSLSVRHGFGRVCLNLGTWTTKAAIQGPSWPSKASPKGPNMAALRNQGAHIRGVALLPKTTPRSYKTNCLESGLAILVRDGVATMSGSLLALA